MDFIRVPRILSDFNAIYTIWTILSDAIDISRDLETIKFLLLLDI